MNEILVLESNEDYPRASRMQPDILLVTNKRNGARRNMRHRKHPVVMGILFLAMIAPILIGASVFTDLQASKAIIAVLVYSNHPMEDKSFELFIDDNLQASGHTGAGNYVRLVLPYTWSSFGSTTVHISAVSSSSDVPSQSTETLMISPGGVYIVNIYI